MNPGGWPGFGLGYGAHEESVTGRYPPKRPERALPPFPRGSLESGLRMQYRGAAKAETPSPTPEEVLLRAVNRSDRETLLAAEGAAGVFARLLARGDGEALRLGAERLDLTGFPTLEHYAAWAARPETTPRGRIRVAEWVLAPSDSAPFLSPAEREARELGGLAREGRWDEVAERLETARGFGEWDPQLAIIEVFLVAHRDPQKALPTLIEASRRFPDHFTIAHMLGYELVRAREAGRIGYRESHTLFTSAEALLARDPYDYGLRWAQYRLRYVYENDPEPRTSRDLTDVFRFGWLLRKAHRKALAEIRRACRE